MTRSVGIAAHTAEKIEKSSAFIHWKIKDSNGDMVCIAYSEEMKDKLLKVLNQTDEVMV
jgi:hypothetical protein